MARPGLHHQPLDAVRQPRAQQRRPRSRRFPRAPLAERRSEVCWRSTTRASRYPGRRSQHPRPSRLGAMGADVSSSSSDRLAVSPRCRSARHRASPANPARRNSAVYVLRDPTNPTRDANFFQNRFLDVKPSKLWPKTQNPRQAGVFGRGWREIPRDALFRLFHGNRPSSFVPAPTTGVSSPSRWTPDLTSGCAEGEILRVHHLEPLAARRAPRSANLFDPGLRRRSRPDPRANPPGGTTFLDRTGAVVPAPRRARSRRRPRAVAKVLVPPLIHVERIRVFLHPHRRRRRGGGGGGDGCDDDTSSRYVAA